MTNVFAIIQIMRHIMANDMRHVSRSRVGGWPGGTPGILARQHFIWWSRRHILLFF